MTGDRSSNPTVLVCGDDALATSLDSIDSDTDCHFCVLSAASISACNQLIDERQVDCVLSRTSLPDCDRPVILYPETPDEDLARESTTDETVQYLPESIDTDDHELLLGAVTDAIDRRRRTDDQLQSEAERDLLAATSSLANVGGWEFDADTEALTWTAETYRLHGLSDEFEPTIGNALEFYHPSDRDSVRADVESALAGQLFDSTYRLYRADGEVRWARSKGVPVYEDGSVVAVRGAFQDVTQQHEREDAIQKFKQAVESAGHAVFITERNGTITYVNPAFETITGYDAQEAIGADPSLLKSGEMDKEYYSVLWKTILSGEVWSKPIVNEKKSGEHYHASETIAPITNDEGTILGFVAIQTDNTEQVRTREQLETFREIVQRLEDPIMLQSLDGSFEVINEAVGEYAGTPTEDLLGRDEFAFMDAAAARTVDERKSHVIETEETTTYELTPTLPSIGERSFVTTRYPHYGEDGEVDGTVAICRDITEQAEREHQLRVLDRILRHNLYNKMNLILGHAELLDDAVDGDLQESVEQILATGSELIGLTDKERRIVDLLTDEAAPKRVEMTPLIEKVRSSMQESFPEATIEMTAELAVDVRAVSEVESALEELVRNAIIHTDDAPAVQISVTRSGEWVSIAVCDNGPGIPEMEREAAAGVSEINPLFHGSGLGLQFVAHVAKRSGGTVSFESASEESSGGSTVVLTLPLWIEDADGVRERR